MLPCKTLSDSLFQPCVSSVLSASRVPRRREERGGRLRRAPRMLRAVHWYHTSMLWNCIFSGGRVVVLGTPEDTCSKSILTLTFERVQRPSVVL